MAYTLIKAVQDIESRLGQYNPDQDNWRYGSLAKIKISHQPFSATPLAKFFEINREGEGSKRTPFLFFEVPITFDRYVATGGSIVR